MIKKLITSTLVAASALSLAVAETKPEIPFPEALEAANVSLESMTNGQKNSLMLGNGDLYGIVWQQNGQWFMRITKNDIWDTRLDTSKDQPLPHADFEKGKFIGKYGDMPAWKNEYPQPRAASGITLSPKLGATTGKLNLLKGVANITTGKADESAEIRILSDRNVVLINSPYEVDLNSIKADTLPDAETGTHKGVKWLHMKMPDDIDVKGVHYAIAVASKGNLKAISLVTSLDIGSEKVLKAAADLARKTLAEEEAKLIATHEKDWNEFWQKSGIELGDKTIQNWWYRTVYFAKTVCKPGTYPVALMPPLATDKTPWHADFHYNYNEWQAFWSLPVVNQGELAEPWIDYVNRRIPRFQEIAKVTYGCKGIHFPISSFLREPDPDKSKANNKRQIMFNPWSLTIGLGGMTVHSAWQKHLYDPDPVYLEKKVYPILEQVALFYVSYMGKCKRSDDGKILLGPSYSPEHGPPGINNCPFDIAFVNYTFDAMIQASKELGKGKKLAAKCAEMQKLLPAYPTAKDENGNDVVVDWLGCKFRQVGVHNITVPCVPVFPADQVTWFSSDAEKKLFNDTIAITQFNGNNSQIMFNVAKARMSNLDGYTDSRKWFTSRELPNGFFQWQGHYHGTFMSEMIGISGLVNEFILQSVDNKIRLFPCWPTDKDAAFKKLRAQGGFLVSASFKGGKVEQAQVESLYGRELQLLSPWETIYANGKALTADKNGLVTLKPKKGEVITFTENP